MGNKNQQMAEFADNFWKNYIRPKVREEFKDLIAFYRAEVVSNDGSNTLTIQRPFDTPYQVSCTNAMSSATAGDQVLVMRFGLGVNNKNHIVVATGDGNFDGA